MERRHAEPFSCVSGVSPPVRDTGHRKVDGLAMPVHVGATHPPLSARVRRMSSIRKEFPIPLYVELLVSLH